MLEGERIVVTGGAGFIGSHLVDALAGGNDVTVLDDFSSGRMENLLGSAGHRIVRGSVTRPSQLRLVFRGADIVFHLAARPSVPASIADPRGSARVNLDGTLNVLEAARRSDVAKVVFSSSCAVYGDAPPPVRETAAPAPRSPYAVQKLAAEHYCRNFQELYGLRTVCLRYFNVFGPRQDPSSQYAAVVPVFFRDLLAYGKVTIFGDGEQTRDFIFVDDVVRANELAARTKRADGAVLNIATGKGTSVNTLANKIARLAGKPLAVKKAPARQGDIKHSYADISKARKLLGFRPETSLVDGLRAFCSAHLA
jgi:nucleoside-diphosphate-sugar epimerase